MILKTSVMVLSSAVIWRVVRPRARTAASAHEVSGGSSATVGPGRGAVRSKIRTPCLRDIDENSPRRVRYASRRY